MVVTRSSPGKVILLGEHAVVYGKPAIGIPLLSVNATVTITRSRDAFSINTFDVHGILTRRDTDHPLINLAIATFKHLGKTIDPLELTVTSTIPVASGLGSGAAVAASLVKALYTFYDVTHDYAAINTLVYQAETQYHGTPSGIDNTIIVYETPIYFMKGHPDTIPISGQFHFLVADTGIPASTRQSVQLVRQQYEIQRHRTQTLLDHIETVVIHARQAIMTGDVVQLGKQMTHNHRLLQQLAVSSTELDQLVNASLVAGSLGAKLSGGGCGGNMITLVTSDMLDTVKTRLIHAGATRIYHTVLEATT